MKKPPQTLKTLLWVNELKENLAREEFQRAKRSLRELEEMLAEISSLPRKLYDELTERPVSGEELRFFSSQVEQLLEEKKRVEEILAQKREEVERLRKKALYLHQRRRMAEILWQRAREHYLKNLFQSELKEIEDQILARRKQDEGL
ncbi:MAG: hypothetical protein GXO20_03140 [Thermodesulfobacteria bacterium]|nr:hypothetical protein [Thermodesulfobacteriota bacterium]